MFRWLQDAIAWLLQLICGHGWTGGVEGAIPFAIGCGVVLFVGLCIYGRTEQHCQELEEDNDGGYSNLICSGMFLSWLLFLIIFAAMYYSSSKTFIFVFALITGGTPKDFTPTPYNFAEWPLRMKIILAVATLMWIWSIYRCKYEKKPLLALIDKFFVMGAMTVVMLAYFYLRELSDENGKSFGFEWLCVPLDLAVWVFLAILPVGVMMSPGYTEGNENKKSPSNPTPAPTQSGRRLPTGSMIRDSEGNSCRIRRDGDFVYIRRPDGSEEQVYAYEFDSNTTLTTSSGHRYYY